MTFPALVFRINLCFWESLDVANDHETVIIDFAGSRIVNQSALQAIGDVAAKYHEAGKRVILRRLGPDCHRFLSRSGQLIVDSDDDPNCQLAVHYGGRLGVFDCKH